MEEVEGNPAKPQHVSPCVCCMLRLAPAPPCLLTRSGTPLLPPHAQATIMPRGHALGMVSQVPDKDEYSTTKQQMLARIDVCMGGKAAEELIFGGWRGWHGQGMVAGLLCFGG